MAPPKCQDTFPTVLQRNLWYSTENLLNAGGNDYGNRFPNRDDLLTCISEQEASEQMQSYHDERSEQWQEGPKAEELLSRLEHLHEAVAHLQEAE